MQDTTEKRKHSRIKVSIPLTYKELRTSEPNSRGALTGNLGEGGVKFSTDKFISLSCRMVVEISLPSIPKPMRAISKVAWIKKDPSGDNYEIGNQFLDMTKDDRSTLAEFVKNTLIPQSSPTPT